MNVWRERLNRWITPFAARIPFSPNTITVAALLTNATAAALLAAGRSEPLLFPVSAFVITGGGLLDAMDGAVARARGETSKWGDFLDHFFDRISDALILTGWCLGAAIRTPLILAALIAVTLNGYAGTQIEATFGQRSYEGPGRGEYVIAVVALPLIQFALVLNGIAAHRLLGLTMAEWLTTVLTLFAILSIVDRSSRARRMSR